MSSVLLDIDTASKRFVLTGNIKPITEDRRLSFSFRRMGAEFQGQSIYIPYENDRRDFVLFELQTILEKYDLADTPTDNIKQILQDYYRERDNFSDFANRAKLIRNDEFKNHKDLVEEFRYFTEVIDKELVRTLYPLQLLSAYHLAFSQHACNFAVPGAGKTTIVYGAYSYLKNLQDENKHVDKILVIGPKSSFAPWENEYEECFGRKPSSIRIDPTLSYREREVHFYSSDPAELTLLHYDSASRLERQIADFLEKNKVMVVVDEAHRIKAKDGTWSSSILGLSKKATARVILTGTPIPNGYQDLYNLVKFIWPQKYKEILGFHYGNLKEMSDAGNPDAPRVQKLTDNVSPFFIRIKKEDLHLPPAIDNPAINVEMGPKQKEIYDFIESKYVASFINDQNAGLKDVFNKAKLIRLRQAATNPSLLDKPLEDYYHELGIVDDLGIDDSELMRQIQNYSKDETPAKFKSILELLQNLLSNKSEKVVIWSIFIRNSKDLQKYLKAHGFKSELLIGEVDQADRELVIKKFNNPDNSDFKVVIANPLAVGESISIHKGCHNAVYLERDYNAASLIQSKDRIHRVGLEPSVVTNYYYIVARDTVDETIHSKLEDKVTRMSKFINKEIPLFVNNLDYEEDETDLIKALLKDYVRRNKQV
ncbi:MAG TPA: DEAD/DEAH box helicase [Candidatus Saccharimonadales bacterium]|nr:DEAD/DEAH box helicase [Candidatus Saccharimonadales bacterium]